MAHVQQKMTNQDTVRVASTPEKAGLGPRTSGHEQKGIKAGRLKGQLFACECFVVTSWQKSI